MIKSKLLYISLFCMLTIVSCKQSERAKRSSLEGKKTEYLIQQMQSNSFDFDTFQSKAEFKIDQGEKTNSFKANIRIKKDSLIWISITPLLGIEMARILITRDTIKVINRFDKEYFIGDYSYINKKFNVELEFEIIQSLMLGNAIPFEEDEKIKFATDKGYYYLGNLKKRKAKKANNKPNKIEKENEELISLWMNPTSFRIEKILFSDLAADRFLLGEYSNYFEVNGQLLPKNLVFNFESKKPAKIKIEYSRVSLNQDMKFSFNISSKYEKVYY